MAVDQSDQITIRICTDPWEEVEVDAFVCPTNSKGIMSRYPASKLKELRVRPAIDDHDLSYRLANGRKFLEQGHKVQVVCIFRGRQMAHPEHGYEVMRKVAAHLEDIAKIEVPAKMTGNRMTMMLSRK